MRRRLPEEAACAGGWVSEESNSVAVTPDIVRGGAIPAQAVH